jgi:Beta-propeller repeat/FG-GAP-like repeat/Viral BACON domain/Putative binding domain, N-terminal/FG-GAP repeat
VQAAYLPAGRSSVRFSLGAYDKHEPVVVDPILVYSTYVGETSPSPPPLDLAEAIAVDAAGNAYLAGTHWPAGNGADTYNSVAFVSKVSPDGSSILYTAHIGGTGNFTQQCYAIAVDSNNNAYITGYTGASNFPTQNPFQSSLKGGSNAFITKLSADGASLVYSTYLGGSVNESGTGITVNGNGNAYVTGDTSSSDFPTVTPFQSTYHGGGDAFVTELSANGTSLVFSTYLGGSGSETSGHIALDSNQNVYVTGSTTSTDFPVAMAFQSTFGGSQDVYVAKLASDGQSLVYSTYLGGSGTDTGTGIAVDSLGAVYITGSTNSANFPTKNPIQSALQFTDAFLSKISSDGSGLVYSTYLGGTALDQGNDIAVDSDGNAYVVGRTYSDNFPTAFPLQGANAGYSSGFASKISSDGSTLLYSTYLGSTGDGGDQATGVAVDSSGAAYVGGYTDGTNFPTTPGSAQSPGIPAAGFVAKIEDSPSPCSYSINPPTLEFGSNASTGTVTVTTGSQCSWIASTNQFWFSITSEETGTGSGAVSYSIAENDGVVGRGAIFSIGSQSINVTQGIAPCVYSFSPTQQAFTSVGGSGATNFLATVTCNGWILSNPNSWIAVPLVEGAGNDTFSFTVAPNPSSTARSGVFSAGTQQFTITQAGATDFAGTGKPNLLWQLNSSGQAAIWYLGGPGGNVYQSFGWLNSGNLPGWTLAGAADFNGDGHPDLMWQNNSTGQVAVWYMGGAGGNVFQSFGWLNSGDLPGWTLVGAADFNGDGHPDLMWLNNSTGQAAVWYMGGAGGNVYQSFGWLNSGDLPGWTLVGAADFNGDGHPDLMWQNNSTGQVAVWYMGGAGGNVFQSFGWLNSGNMSGWTVVGAVDLNADGHPDLIWQNNSTGQVAVWYMGGAQGNVYQSWAWIDPVGQTGLTAIARFN